jgi:Domain of unknown function (DUF4337)
MDSDDKGQKSDGHLNNLVAVTVVIITVFLAVSKVKDDNIVQAMAKAQATSVDAWNEYQAARIKLHVDENALSTLRLMETSGSINKELAAKQAAAYEADIAKYEQRSKETMTKAKAQDAEYNRLNAYDDQFDISEAFISIAIAVAAIAALLQSYALLCFAWASGATGMAFGIAGFLGWNFRPEFLVQLIGT